VGAPFNSVFYSMLTESCSDGRLDAHDHSFRVGYLLGDMDWYQVFTAKKVCFNTIPGTPNSLLDLVRWSWWRSML
jgi:hypothetical protein